MAVLGGSLFSKVIGWHKKPADRKSYMQWPKDMLPYLEKEFYLLPREMASLQCIAHQGRGLPFYHVRLYDRLMAYQQGTIIRDYHDLDKHPELIRFEGHIFKDGKVYLRRKHVNAN